MITTLRTGFYKLIETKHQIKILYLDKDTYAWPQTKEYGEMLVVSRREHKTDCVLAMGHYYLYQVKDEVHATDLMHLELEVGKNGWQGYLLLTGLPNQGKKRVRIIPTQEIITGNPRYKDRHQPYKDMPLLGMEL